MASTANVTLEVHPVGSPRWNLWCPACALPSAWEQDAAVADGATLAVVGRLVVRGCTECGQLVQLPR